MHVFRWLIAISFLVVASPAFASGSSSQCVEGSPEPVDAHSESRLRPDRTAICPYDFAELTARITKLSLDKHDFYSVEVVEKAFGMPMMTTSYDDPRSASYSMILSGKDGWKLLVWVRESFYPLDKGPAAFVPGAFVPGLRPKRIFNVHDADLRVDLDILGGGPASSSVRCIPVSPFFDALLSRGWKDIEMRVSPPTDGGLQTPLFQNETKRVSINGQRGQCAQSVVLMQNTVNR